MIQSVVVRGARRRTLLPMAPGPFAGFLLAGVALVVIGVVTYRALETRADSAARVTQTLQTISQVEALSSTIKDAETGQRGYLLTGDESYLEPYATARTKVADQIFRLREAVAAVPVQQARVERLVQLTNGKLDELAQTIALKKAGNTEAALAIVRGDTGKFAMDSIRSLIAEIEGDERRMLDTRQVLWDEAVRASTTTTAAGALVLMVLIGAAAITTSRDYRQRERETWLRTGQMQLATRLQGEQRLETLGDHVLEFLAGYLGAQVGAFYVTDGNAAYQRYAGYALAPGSAGGALQNGDSLVGQAAKERRPLHVRDVPAGYLSVNSTLGQAAPRALLILPATEHGVVHAVIELGFFRALVPDDMELATRVSDAVAIAVRSAKDRTRLEDLLEETQRQSEELQVQQEELRVTNEELEEQSHALKESQVRLEAQQAELEQSNAQLEEQTQMLEHQKDELSQAQDVLTQRAADLERANQYKGEFLANMSHELRTPLNSALILAKLLADNKEGNLNAEQVRYAQTISSAGHDLLALINDILDLSKIEAGRVEVTIEPVTVSRVVDGRVRTFDATARERGLAFRAVTEPGTPPRFSTDAQRLDQILKNLLSNALKFTERGEVELRVSARPDGVMAFEVRDTGVGIPEHQQDLIFEAFRQADGSTHRRFGGTGLGLSISRDLAHLLGGDIAVHSEAGKGSCFTLTLPLEPAATAPAVRVARSSAPAARLAPPAPAPKPARATTHEIGPAAFEDDRDRLTGEARRILVIEDDHRFASILCGLARELQFQCVVTHTAADGLAAAILYRPHAILLDVNLPDRSGLGVLDELKSSPQTRHLPVHVLSVADYSHEALERGAIGYALKPVNREQLVGAFRHLEAKLSQGLRRVLVIEDDARQRESIRQLLEAGDVEIVGAATAMAALDRLRTTTFDCMVMDLSLPDMSGYELLERMAGEEDLAFPPVIVYTGRSLTRAEEQRLHRFSKSIIIKDARSPERLLDEVTLFLHQVESAMPQERQRMLQAARHREAALEGRRVLVVEDDARNIFALSSVLEPKGIRIEIARNGREAIQALNHAHQREDERIDLVLMDIMMPEMDGLTATLEIRSRPEWKKLPIIALTAKAMKDDQERCLAAGANDYIAKPLDVEKLLSLIRVWMPK
jgi:signal transduction histidine kinase/DNA-binding response OmpR family regulator/CHASE3 domain sensor protein